MAMRPPLTATVEGRRFESMDPSSLSSLLERLRNSDRSSPLIFFLFFHKAIRSEFDRLHRAAVALATDGVGDVESISRRCGFLFSMYQHHSNAEDEVPNRSYLINLVNVRAVLCDAAISVFDELQLIVRFVLPIARTSFSPEKQRKILYQSICVMPLRLIERALPWLVATLCEDEARSFLHNMELAGQVFHSSFSILMSVKGK
ncbi:hypothetical protein BHM03_00002487 [Ensete ventricosum]|nr:hypothetical protein BHM03_00002487 [Ensete ventricosum]